MDSNRPTAFCRPLCASNIFMRRPIASRNAGWAKQTARFLAARGVRPNMVSGASVVFAALAAVCVASAPQVENQWQKSAFFIGAALFIQLRLLCNLFDGMLAVEFAQGSALGPIWNDFPDRPADVLILAACGFAGGPPWLPTLGWLAAVGALLTAYIRVLGAAIGAKETFAGPMAKPQRMALATIACVLASAESALHWPPRAMTAALFLIIMGCFLTVVRRLKFIANDLQKGAKTP